VGDKVYKGSGKTIEEALCGIKPVKLSFKSVLKASKNYGDSAVNWLQPS
jgi:hypothetical protein